MPLPRPSTSKKSFEQVVRTEVNAGRPTKQAVAIAYSQQRKAKKERRAK